MSIVDDMKAAPAVTDLVGRVRGSAADRPDVEQPGPIIYGSRVREALRLELQRATREIETNPSRWASWADGADMLGSAYEMLVSSAERRDAGQFLTPMWAAELMACWLAEQPIECLWDPGVGSGRLLLTSAQQPRPPVQMLGIDIDPISLMMAKLNLQLRGITTATFHQGDFLLGDMRGRPDAIISNPPFSRHQAIPAWRKDAIHEQIRLRHGVDLSRLAGLHVMFFMRALDVLREGGRLAFITPLPWLDVNYGEVVKGYALAHAHVDGLIIFDDREKVFGRAKTTATITLLTKGAEATTNTEPTRVVRIGPERPPMSDVVAAVAGRTSSVHPELVTLRADEPWSTRPRSKRQPPGRPLQEYARVRRGVATGCKPFFVISEQARRKHQLELRDLRACITSPKLIAGLELTNTMLDELPGATPRWMISTQDPAAEEGDDPLGAYLRLGREYGADGSYLAQHREPWYRLEQRGTCPIVFTLINKRRARFIRNRSDALALNNFMIIEPHADVNADRLWQALNKPALLGQLEHSRRPYGHGMWKLERHELDQLRIGI